MANTVPSGKQTTTTHHGKRTDLWRKGEPQSVRDANDEYQGGDR